MNSDCLIEKLFARLNIQDISELGTDAIEEFFYGINMEEILKLSTTNTRFNEVYKRESFWKKKVLLDYGVKKKCRGTWEETAKLLCDSNMINLGKEWINGQTYRDLFKQALENNGLFERILTKERFDEQNYDEESLRNDGLFELTLNKYYISRSFVYVYPEEMENAYPDFVVGLENVPIEHIALHLGYTINDLKDFGIGSMETSIVQYVKKVTTRELSVIIHAVEVAKRIYEQDWQNEINELQGGDLKTSKEIESLIDPIRYVIFYSSQSLKTLNAIKL
uniref:F-box-like family protein n=1 Tax=Pithovirus LCPAC401 TaxID=2506595 RepID=A0A481Z9Y3_9VIRU|nr:MAG: F-box-like family protein [Pithovirus LCPAC401]